MKAIPTFLSLVALTLLAVNWTSGQEYGGPEAPHHPEFYSLIDKDYRHHDSIKLEEIKTPYDCALQVIERGHSLAAYNEPAQTCHLKKVRWNWGHTYNAWNRLLGPYDVPFYDKEETYDKKARKAWLKGQECDAIHVSPDGHLWCKLYETSPGTTLLFRYYHQSA